jgi:hypothetical protein
LPKKKKKKKKIQAKFIRKFQINDRTQAGLFIQFMKRMLQILNRESLVEKEEYIYIYIYFEKEKEKTRLVYTTKTS